MPKPQECPRAIDRAEERKVPHAAIGAVVHPHDEQARQLPGEHVVRRRADDGLEPVGDCEGEDDGVDHARLIDPTLARADRCRDGAVAWRLRRPWIALIGQAVAAAR